MKRKSTFFVKESAFLIDVILLISEGPAVSTPLILAQTKIISVKLLILLEFDNNSLEIPVYLEVLYDKIGTNVRGEGGAGMDNRNRDRGTIKWTSLMLPEHVEMVKKLWREDQRVEKGIMDEQKAVEIDFLMQRALKDDLTVKARIYNGFEYEDLLLKLEHVNKMDRVVSGVNWETKESARFSLDDIADLSIL